MYGHITMNGHMTNMGSHMTNLCGHMTNLCSHMDLVLAVIAMCNSLLVR